MMKSNFYSLCILFLSSVFSLSVRSQDCTPDLLPPVLKLYPAKTIYIDNAPSYFLKLEECIQSVSDNCSSLQEIRLSFSRNGAKSEIEIPVGSRFPVDVEVFAFDKSGNVNNQMTKITIDKCTPSLACNDGVKINLVPGTSIVPKPELFLEGSYCADHKFRYFYTVSGKPEDQLVLITGNLAPRFQYRVLDLQTQNSCWGNVDLQILDCSSRGKFQFECNSKSVSCTEDMSPELVGFPLNLQNYKLSRTNRLRTYLVKFDSLCPAAELFYIDSAVSYDCNSNLAALTYRQWVAVLPDGKVETCVQKLSHDRSLKGFGAFLKNYDGSAAPILDCKDFWPVDAKGNPDPSFTGFPLVSSCTKFIGVNYEDVTFQNAIGNCGIQTKIIRIWTALDWCNNEKITFTQVILINCINDQEPPVPVCTPSLTLSLDANKQLIVFAKDFDLGSYDNCGPVSFAFDSSGLVRSKIYGLSDAGQEFLLNMFVFDALGNYEYCKVILKVVDKGTNAGFKTLISGKMLDYNLKPKPANISFTLQSGNQFYSSTNCPVPTKYPDNNYAICVDSTAQISTCRMVPSSRVTDVLNGLSIGDVLQAMRGIFGAPLNPYERIAADVDCDDRITIYDLFDMRRMILGIINNFKCKENYDVYTADLNSPRPIRNVDISPLPDFQMNLVPVRKGDVNGSGFFNLKDPVVSRTNDEYVFYINNINLVKDQYFDVYIVCEKPYEIYAVQMGQIFDNKKVQIIGLSSPFLDLYENNHYVINERDWRGLFMNEAISLMPISDGFIKIKIRSLIDGELKEAFNIVENPIPTLVIDKDVELVESRLEFRSFVNTDNPNAEISEVKVLPNPNRGRFDIQLQQAVPFEWTVELFGTEGTPIYRSSVLPKEQTIHQMEIGTSLPSGIYYGRVNAGNEIRYFRFVKQ